MIIYLTEVTITDHPDYEVLFGVPTTSMERAQLNVKSHLMEEMEDCGEDGEIIIHHVSDNQIKMTYEGCLNSYYITAHEVE